MRPGSIARATVERVRGAVRRHRERSGWFDHTVATVEHYTKVDGGVLAGAATYFGFLSFFPVLAISFFVVGQVASVYPEARRDLLAILDVLLPELVGDGEGQVPLQLFEDNAGRVGIAGFVGAVYAGSNWMTAVRNALSAVFEQPRDSRFDLLRGKVRDLLTMLLVAVMLMVSVSVSGLVAALSEETLDRVGLGGGVTVVLLWLVGHAVALGATTALFVVLFRLLAPVHQRRRSLVEGALLGAVAFELLKAVAYVLIGYTRSQPAFAAFGTALVLVVWISYFCRILLLGASWAHTADPDRSGTPGTMER
jgi:membrane protein